MQRESPKALPTTFENTKFPAIDDKLKQLLANREEALAAHKLARTQNSRTKEKYVYSIRKRTKGLAGHTQSKNELSQKDGTQMRRTI